MRLIERDGGRVAALLHDPALEDEQELLTAVTAAAGIALENARLNVELRARVEELRGSRARIVEAGQRERQRLERNLHDGAQHRLVALSLQLSLLEEELAGQRSATVQLERARREIDTSSTSCVRLRREFTPRSSPAMGSPSRSSSSSRVRRFPCGSAWRSRGVSRRRSRWLPTI
jgi:signal transduction histidine kinase